MKCISIFIIGFFSITFCFGQQVKDSLKIVDELYREDQFYMSLTYNLLGQKPTGLSQSGFSSGFHFGYLRDMPINEKRNIAIAVGLGLSSNSYNQNMLIETGTDKAFDYSIIDEETISFSKNKFTTYLVEVPIEFRWRTSTSTDYSFWRIYTGIRFGYVFYNSSKFRGSLGAIKNSGISDFNNFRYGLTLSTGYSTWNAHIYYGLNTIFKNSATLEGQAIDTTSVKIGLMFYIL